MKINTKDKDAEQSNSVNTVKLTTKNNCNFKKNFSIGLLKSSFASFSKSKQNTNVGAVTTKFKSVVEKK